MCTLPNERFLTLREIERQKTVHFSLFFIKQLNTLSIREESLKIKSTSLKLSNGTKRLLDTQLPVEYHQSLENTKS